MQGYNKSEKNHNFNNGVFVGGLRGEVQNVHSLSPKGPLLGSGNPSPPPQIDPGYGPGCKYYCFTLNLSDPF